MTEALLRPRYKVVADYFYNPYKIGDIITVMYDDRSVHLTTTRYRDEFGEMIDQHNYMHPGELKKFPHLFKKLEWYEERKLEEMPEYLKCLSPDFCFKKGDIIEVGKWIECFGPTLRFYSIHTDKLTLHPHHYLPATLAEYEQYINQKEKQ